MTAILSILIFGVGVCVGWLAGNSGEFVRGWVAGIDYERQRKEKK